MSLVVHELAYRTLTGTLHLGSDNIRDCDVGDMHQQYTYSLQFLMSYFIGLFFSWCVYLLANSDVV